MIDIHPQDARHAVIWLHGLGDSGAGLAPLVDAATAPSQPGTLATAAHMSSQLTRRLRDAPCREPARGSRRARA